MISYLWELVPFYNIKPILDRLYIGLNIEEIVGYSIAIVIIDRLEGKKQMQLL